MGKQLAVIVKPTYACNAACDYCSVHKLGDVIKPMKHETFELLIERAKDFLLPFEGKSGLMFYWLGGEPLVVGDRFYEEILNYLDHVDVEDRITFRHAMQSNLLLFAKKEMPHVKKMLTNENPEELGWTYQLGTSFDPVSDARKLKGEGDYKKQFMEAYFKIRQEKAKIGVILVAHKGTTGKAKQIYQFFKNLGFTGFNLNTMIDYQGEFSYENLEMTTKEYGELLIEMFACWEADDFKMPLVPFESWKQLMLTGNGSTLRCHNDGRCSESLFAVGPDGDVFHCDRAMQAYEKPLGNLATHSFEQMQTKKTFKDRMAYLVDNECAGCKWWDYCKGACPYESKEQYQGKFGKTHWCESYKMLYEYMENRKVFWKI